MPTSTAPSARTRIRRLPERAHYDNDTLTSIIDAAIVCNVAFQMDGVVHAIPTIHWREGEYLYIHGAKASRMLKALMHSEVCITITHVDGLVLARSAMHHSMNYRSAVIYGKFEPVTETEEKQRSLQAFLNGLYPGRWETLRPMTTKELNATSVLRISLMEASAKVREGGAKDDEGDLDWPVWAGVIPLQTTVGTTDMEADSAITSVPVTRFDRQNDDETREA